MVLVPGAVMLVTSYKGFKFLGRLQEDENWELLAWPPGQKLGPERSLGDLTTYVPVAPDEIPQYVGWMTMPAYAEILKGE